jgi:hypothetical protein
VSKQTATIDDTAANQQEVDEQMEQDTVEKAARENANFPAPIMNATEETETADNAVASGEEVAEQAQESRIDKVAFEDAISTAAAEEYIGRGRTHD